MLRVTCYVLRVTCYVLRVACYLLRVTCNVLRDPVSSMASAVRQLLVKEGEGGASNASKAFDYEWALEKCDV